MQKKSIKENKVLFIQAVPRFGGALMSLFLLMKNIRLVPILVTSREGKLTDMCKREGIKFYTLPLPMWRKLKSWKVIPFSLTKLVSIALKENVDLIYANTLWDIPYAVTLGKLLKLKKIGHIRNTFSYDKIGKYLLWWVDGVIAVSFAVSKPLWRTHIFWKVIYNGVVDSLFEKGFLNNNDNFKIVLVGRIDSTKGQDIAIKALALTYKKVKKLELYVAGEESYLEKGLLNRLKKQAKSLGIAERVHFLGHVDDVYSLFKSAELSIVPSKFSSKEGFGRIIPEAFINKTPVIATNIGGMPEVMIHTKTGYLVPPDAFTFSDKIILYYVYPVLIKKHGINGYRRAKNKFLIDFTSRNIEEFLRSILS